MPNSVVENVSIIGAGFVGLSTAVVFASKGIKTTCVDIDNSKLEKLENAYLPFFEPNLEPMLRKAIENGNLSFTDELASALNSTEMTFVTVGTPQNNDGSIDLSQVKSVCSGLAKHLKENSNFHVIVIKSTVIPGSSSVINEIIERESGKKSGRDFGLVINPEFLREGQAIADTLNPNFILIGSFEALSAGMVESFYRNLYDSKVPKIIHTNPYTAELVKYATNAFLASKISFINTIANICQRIPETDIEQVAEIIGLDPRIGQLFLKAGPGYGGSCLPKDVNALIRFSEELGYNAELLKSVRQVNIKQRKAVLALVYELLGEVHGKTISILGLSFKKNSDDVREAVSIKIVKELLSQGAIVKVHDPMAMENFRKILDNRIIYSNRALECVKGTDCCVILTDWDEYRSLQPEDFIRNMNEPIVIDARRVLDHKKFLNKLRFAAIGLGNADLKDYKNPGLSVNAIIEKDGSIMLVRRNTQPFRGMWSLPGGYVEYGEKVEDALKREIYEELGLRIEPLLLLGVYSDPFRNPSKHVVSITYLARILDGKLKENTEIAEASFFKRHEIPVELAFDHAKMISDYYSSFI